MKNIHNLIVAWFYNIGETANFYLSIFLMICTGLGAVGFIGGVILFMTGDVRASAVLLRSTLVLLPSSYLFFISYSQVFEE